MKRIERDPEELREIDDALARAAAPMHMTDSVAPDEQPTIEFDSREVIRGLGQLGEFGTPFGIRLPGESALGDDLVG